MPRKTRGTTAPNSRRTYYFNEAAARCRGKRPRVPAELGREDDFNEAAARCRGKRTMGGRLPSILEATSMRPRLDAAENAGSLCDRLLVEVFTSMRPRLDAAEN